MISRYDLMVGSNTEYDSVDKQVYPDPLSVDFNSFLYTQPPYIVEPDERLQYRPYLMTNAFYQTAAYDDIILNINGVPHICFIMNYSTINFPVYSDLAAFMKKGVS